MCDWQKFTKTVNIIRMAVQIWKAIAVSWEVVERGNVKKVLKIISDALWRWLEQRQGYNSERFGLLRFNFNSVYISNFTV